MWLNLAAGGDDYVKANAARKMRDAFAAVMTREERVNATALAVRLSERF